MDRTLNREEQRSFILSLCTSQSIDIADDRLEALADIESATRLQAILLFNLSLAETADHRWDLVGEATLTCLKRSENNDFEEDAHSIWTRIRGLDNPWLVLATGLFGLDSARVSGVQWEDNGSFLYHFLEELYDMYDAPENLDFMHEAMDEIRGLTNAHQIEAILEFDIPKEETVEFHWSRQGEKLLKMMTDTHLDRHEARVLWNFLKDLTEEDFDSYYASCSQEEGASVETDIHAVDTPQTVFNASPSLVVNPEAFELSSPSPEPMLFALEAPAFPRRVNVFAEHEISDDSDDESCCAQDVAASLAAVARRGIL